jgi:hypothetical protein
MGLFDQIRSSYDLGPDFTNVELQTKGLACAMARYWISPDGCLYELTYRETHTFEIIEEDDERYDPKLLFLNYEWIPTGKRGKVEPCYITDYIEVYPALWDGDWVSWPRLKLHFVKGRLMDYEHKTR